MHDADHETTNSTTTILLPRNRVQTSQKDLLLMSVFPDRMSALLRRRSCPLTPCSQEHSKAALSFSVLHEHLASSSKRASSQVLEKGPMHLPLRIASLTCLPRKICSCNLPPNVVLYLWPLQVWRHLPAPSTKSRSISHLLAHDLVDLLDRKVSSYACILRAHDERCRLVRPLLMLQSLMNRATKTNTTSRRKSATMVSSRKLVTIAGSRR